MQDYTWEWREFIRRLYFNLSGRIGCNALLQAAIYLSHRLPGGIKGPNGDARPREVTRNKTHYDAQRGQLQIELDYCTLGIEDIHCC